MKGHDKNNAFSDHQSELAELSRRLSTLTQALSEKAEENLDVRAELEQLKSERVAQNKKMREAEVELERLRQERQAQDELNVEFQRRISTLSVCLTELAELNAAALSDKVGVEEARHLLGHNAQLELVARQALMGENGTGSNGGAMGSPLEARREERERSRSASPASGGTPMTPQVLQDYHSEIEKLKFRLKKRKAKMGQMREIVAQHKDRADSASKSCVKYEKELKRLNREAEESLSKELAKRRLVEQTVKTMQRRMSELEFLLDDKGEEKGGEKPE